jgi:hypothetical protein
VWEEAVDRRLVIRTTLEGEGPKVAITASGLRLLREHGRAPC